MSEFNKSEPAADETGIGRVLRAAGGRDHPTEAMQRQVRDAVHAEWRAAVTQRTPPRRWIGFAAAAAVAVLALGLWAGRAWVAAPRVVIANVSRAEGAVSMRDGSWLHHWISWQRWQAVSARQSLRSGAALMTGADGRTALALPNGISLRLDHNTQIALVDAGRVEVHNGAVYVDAGGASSALPLQIGTPAGAVRHIGTQYEVRLLKPGVRIRVREGRVELSNPAGVVERVHAGEQLTVAASGRQERSPVDAGGAEWAWVTDVAPPFDIQGRSLREFLTWIGRELGREIVFATSASEAEAAHAMLHGSIVGLAPAEALAAVLPTTSLRGFHRDGQIVIELNAPYE